MKRTALSFALLSLLLASCAMDPSRQQGRQRYGYAGTDAQVQTQYQPQPAPQPSAANPTPTDPAADASAQEPKPEEPSTPPTPPPPPVVEKKDYPYGTAVPNKPGFVTSPHAPYSGYVDVRGFPPGTEVKDPYTGKIFLVP